MAGYVLVHRWWLAKRIACHFNRSLTLPLIPHLSSSTLRNKMFNRSLIRALRASNTAKVSRGTSTTFSNGTPSRLSSPPPPRPRLLSFPRLFHLFYIILYFTVWFVFYSSKFASMYENCSLLPLVPLNSFGIFLIFATPSWCPFLSFY